MKFKMPKDGDIRIKTKFALFPIMIDKEIRWLERVNIRQYYSEYFGNWRNDCFIDMEGSGYKCRKLSEQY